MMHRGMRFPCMPARLWWLPVLLLLTIRLAAQESAAPFAILEASDTSLLVAPGRLVTKAFYISNRSSSLSNVAVSVAGPAGWRVVAGEERLSIGVKEGDTVLISLFVPSAEPAGTRHIEIRVYDPETGHTLAEAQYDVAILAMPRVTLEHTDSPGFVLAGEIYTSRFLLENSGNVGLRVELRSRSGLGYEHSFGSPSIPLDPGERREIRVLVRTPADLGERRHHVLRLFAADGSYASVTDNASSSVDVLPRVSGKEEIFQRLPIHGSITEAIRKNETISAAALARLDAVGELAGSDHFEMHLQAPFDSIGMFTAADPTISLFYRREEWELFAGTGFFTVSDLLLASLYGYGARAEYRFNEIAVGGQSFTTDLTGTGTDLTSLHGTWGVGRPSRVTVRTVHELANAESRVSGGVEAYLVARDGLRFEGEYAVGAAPNLSDAYRISIADSRPGFSYSIGAIRAAPEFLGQLDDLLALEASASLSLGASTSASVSFKRTSVDLASPVPDTVETAAWTVQHRLGSAYSLLLGGRQVSSGSADGAAHASGRVKISYSDGPMSVAVSGKTEQNREQIESEIGASDSLGVDFAYRFDPGGALTVGMGAEMPRDHSVPGETTLELSYSGPVSDRLNIDVGYITTAHGGSYYSGRDLVVAGVAGKLAGDGLLELSGTWAPSRSAERYRDFELSIGYSGHFSLPIRRLPQGRVAGFVRDSETGAGVPEVVLSVGDRVAITDLEGRFLFHSLSPGTHLVSVDPTRVSGEHLVEEPLPHEVTVHDGDTTEIVFHLTEPASLEGTVSRFSYSGSTLGTHGSVLTDEGGVGELLVVLESELDRARAITRRDGSFEVHRLLPGTWRCRLEPTGIPEGYDMPGELEIELGPGETGQIVFELVPRQRAFTIQEESGVLEETEREE